MSQAEDVNDLFEPFIDAILRREIEQKWIDKSSEIATPLLSLEEHHELLAMLSEEMWLNKRSSLPQDSCESLAEIFCDAHRKTPIITRQVKERLSNHALLVSDSTRTQISFDHDHFREFFLGELLGSYIFKKQYPDLRKLLRIEALSNFTLDMAISYGIRRGIGSEVWVPAVQDAASGEANASFVRENAGALIIRSLARRDANMSLVVKGLIFPPESLSGRKVESTSFRDSFFASTELSRELCNVHFTECEFEHLELASESRFAQISFDTCVINSLSIYKAADDTVSYFDPKTIDTILVSRGLKVTRNDAAISLLPIKEEDRELGFVRKLLTIFGRSLNVGERVLTLKMGTNSTEFFQEILPQLLEGGLVEEVQHRGGGVQRNFRLALPFADVADALSRSKGSFGSFMTQLHSS